MWFSFFVYINRIAQSLKSIKLMPTGKIMLREKGEKKTKNEKAEIKSIKITIFKKAKTYIKNNA